MKKEVKKKKAKKNDFWSKIGDVVKNAADCCIE